MIKIIGLHLGILLLMASLLGLLIDTNPIWPMFISLPLVALFIVVFPLNIIWGVNRVLDWTDKH